MKNLCSNCSKRATCTELCPKAAQYADQDYIGREQAFNIRGAIKWKGAGLFRDSEDPKEKAQAIRLLHKRGKSYEEISIHLECDEDFIREVLEDD